MQFSGGLQDLLKEGSRHFTGLEQAVLRNIEACKQLTQITKTSLGPHGMNKIVVNHIDKIFMTSDAATIVKEMEVVHPAAKILCLAAQRQQEDYADGANILLSLSGELLSNAENLVRMGIHPNYIVSGYKKALDTVLKRIEEKVTYQIGDLKDESQVLPALKSILGSKFYGQEDVLAPLVTQACINSFQNQQFETDNIRVAKVLGGSIWDSTLVRGMLLTRETEGSIRRVENAKIAVFGCPLDPQNSDTKSTVLIKNAEELQNYSISEETNTKNIINDICDSGINAIIVGGTVHEMCLHFLERRNILVFKCQSKFDLRRICRVVGAQAIPRLCKPNPEELGNAELIETQEIGNTKVTIIKSESSLVNTLVLRGSSKNTMDEAERAIDSAVNAFKQATKSQKYLPGAGATEIYLAKCLKEFAGQEPSLDQYAIQKFSEALEIVPRMIAENAGLNANKTISQLYKVEGGIDVETGNILENPQIYDHLETKKNAIKLAAEAAMTLLRVDQIIMAKPAGGPKPREAQAPDHEDD